MTKAQQLYERVEELVKEGSTKVDAYRRVAEEFGLKPSSVRGAVYQHTRKANGGGGRSRRSLRETTPAGAVDNAIEILERAIARIDEELDVAKERVNEAKAEYEALKASADERKQQIQTKIGSLSAA